MILQIINILINKLYSLVTWRIIAWQVAKYFSKAVIVAELTFISYLQDLKEELAL